MTREEEIELALSKYIEERGNCGDYIAEADRDAAFKAGANFADENPINVWHSIDVEPQKGSWFLGQIGDNAYDTFIAEIEGKSMKDWLIGCNIKQWAYISDLVPKKNNHDTKENLLK